MSGAELISSKFDNLQILNRKYFDSQLWRPFLKLLHTEHSMLTQRRYVNDSSSLWVSLDAYVPIGRGVQGPCHNFQPPIARESG